MTLKIEKSSDVLISVWYDLLLHELLNFYLVFERIISQQSYSVCLKV